MNPADAALLQQIFRRENRSLLQYARQASPYTGSADHKLLDTVKRIADEEADTLRNFGEWLETQRVSLPPLGTFPMAYTDWNFVSVRFLLPKLLMEQQRDTAALERDAATLSDSDTRATMNRLVELHRRHLAELEPLAV